MRLAPHPSHLISSRHNTPAVLRQRERTEGTGGTREESGTKRSAAAWRRGRRGSPARRIRARLGGPWPGAAPPPRRGRKRAALGCRRRGGDIRTLRPPTGQGPAGGASPPAVDLPQMEYEAGASGQKRAAGGGGDPRQGGAAGRAARIGGVDGRGGAGPPPVEVTTRLQPIPAREETTRLQWWRARIQIRRGETRRWRKQTGAEACADPTGGAGGGRPADEDTRVRSPPICCCWTTFYDGGGSIRSTAQMGRALPPAEVMASWATSPGAR
ncbi:hypothetical protein PVAP13_4NG063940 [Panicum virgatum]|uniref:Uncharacterized protein n=1 Tax=Panicum virgatum TaxID=38727 RepID=A0A8T0T291_PANVG|nr:hypothetical protein PVAP13_4NG063940 [Panicum virgatum]